MNNVHFETVALQNWLDIIIIWMNQGDPLEARMHKPKGPVGHTLLKPERIDFIRLFEKVGYHGKLGSSKPPIENARHPEVFD